MPHPNSDHGLSDFQRLLSYGLCAYTLVKAHCGATAHIRTATVERTGARAACFSSMLPIATSVDGLAGQGSQGRGGLAPMIAKGPSRPALHAHNGASVVPRSKPLPVGRGPAGAGGAKSAMTALAEAPTAASSACHSEQVVEFGYDKNIEEKYELGRELGKVRGRAVARFAPRTRADAARAAGPPTRARARAATHALPRT